MPRLVLSSADDVDSEVTTPAHRRDPVQTSVDIPVRAIADAGRIMSLRRGAIPDGSAIRLSLARRVTVNTMAAGERIFADLCRTIGPVRLPAFRPKSSANWAERARAAERALRLRARRMRRRSARHSRARLRAADLRAVRV